jgi:hypothetical protein
MKIARGRRGFARLLMRVEIHCAHVKSHFGLAIEQLGIPRSSKDG